MNLDFLIKDLCGDMKKHKKRYKTGIHTSNKCVTVTFKFRSSWEQKLACCFDADSDVVSYSYEPMSIPYVSNVWSGRTRKYYPDFLVTRCNGSRELIEVKPKRKLTQRVVQKKLASAQEWCSCNNVTLRVITEVELGEYEQRMKEV